MEPWRLEEHRQLRWERRLAALPRCACCDGHISTERYLELTPFGIAGYACENCVEENLRHWQDLEDRAMGRR